MNVTEKIRRACAEVARRGRFVRIIDERIEPYALSLPLEKIVAPAVDRSTHYVADEAGTVAYFVTLDAINFGSGYFPHLKKQPGRSGYFTIAMGLKEEFEKNGPIPAGRLAILDEAMCAKIFGQTKGDGTVRGLMGLFASALNDLGRLVISKYDGRFTKLVETAKGSARKLVEILSEMPFFRDVEKYEGIEVPFYKRAQLTSADLSIALEGKGLGRFDDLDQLTMFADNLVPHVLRVDGVLAYDAGLAERIDREELIASGSAEEVEIRACAVHAVELMKEALLRAGKRVTAMGLDYLLWNRGQEKYYKEIKPRHRCRGVYY